jgi:hypothetical protein
VTLVVFMMAAGPVPAAAQDAKSREDDMFKTPAAGARDATPPASFPDEKPEKAVAGDKAIGERVGEPEMNRKLDEAQDKLAIGARMLLRMEYAARDEGEAGKFPLYAPNIFDLYLDGRPNDRVRAYAAGRLDYDYTARDGDLDAFGQPRESLRARLDQLWLKFDINRAVYVTAGKQRIKWGSGRVWNPTDFLNPQRLNPLNILDERLGVSLLKVHVPVESLNWNLYAIGVVEGADTPEKVGGALRGEFLLGPTELALSAATRTGDPLRLGADLTFGRWLFDFRAEAAFTQYNRRVLPAGAAGIETPGAFGTGLTRDGWTPQVLGGAEIAIKYSDQDSVYVGAEYFFNGTGYDGKGIYLDLLMNNAFVPLYNGRHYAAVYVLVPNPGDLNNTSFTLTGIGNLSDRSYATRLDYSVRVLTHLSVNAYGQVQFGEEGEFKLAIDVPPIAAAPAPYNQGVHIPPTVLVLGAALTLSY